MDFSGSSVKRNINHAFFVPLLYNYIKKINESFYEKEDDYRKFIREILYINKLRVNRLSGTYEDDFYKVRFPDRKEYFGYLYTN